MSAIKSGYEASRRISFELSYFLDNRKPVSGGVHDRLQKFDAGRADEMAFLDQYLNCEVTGLVEVSITAFDLNERGDPIQAWVTGVDETEAEGVDHAKELANARGRSGGEAGGPPGIGEEEDPIIVSLRTSIKAARLVPSRYGSSTTDNGLINDGTSDAYVSSPSEGVNPHDQEYDTRLSKAATEVFKRRHDG